MSRSSGKFPRYTKLKIDPDEWPANYFGSCRYCDVCEMCWPTSHLFTACPKCGEETVIDEQRSPDIRWPDAVKELLTSRFEALYDQYNEGLTDEQLAWNQTKQELDFNFDSLDSELEEEVRSKAA